MFAYPVGPHKDVSPECYLFRHLLNDRIISKQLFLDRELAEAIDPREDRTSVIRKSLKDILISRMHRAGSPGSSRGPQSPTSPANGGTPPVLPPIQGVSDSRSQNPQGLVQGNEPGSSFQLPPLEFDDSLSGNKNQFPNRMKSPLSPGGRTSLSPITERTREGSTDHSMMGASSVSRSSTQNEARSPPSHSNSLAMRQNSAGGVQGVPMSIREESVSNLANLEVQRTVSTSPPPAVIEKDVKPPSVVEQQRTPMLSKQSTTSSKYSDESAEVGAPTDHHYRQE